MSDRVEKWAADYAAGLSTHKIAVKYGISQTTVWQTLRSCVGSVVALRSK